MNHYISGIIKIIILEAGIGLLLIDRIAGERFERARRIGFATIAGAMVFAWSNYGGMRGGSSWGYAVSAIPMILLCGWLVRAGFGAEPTALMRTFRAAAADFGKGLKVKWPAFPKLVAVLLTAAVAFGWVWLGVRTKSVLLVHQWEQFHFYLGAKYQKEVGSFDLYEAAVVADRETVNAMANVKTTRDIHTFDEVPVQRAFDNADRLRGKFTPERWEEFKRDWTTLTRTWPMDWGRAVNDHGNSDSPAWAAVAHPIAELVPLSQENQAFLGWLDMLLMLAMWLFIYETFGTRAASVGLLFWAAPPIVFDYLTGSFLRWDWLFSLGMAACFIKRGRYATAGAFAGFAAATKLFPILFSVGLGFRAFFDWRQTKQLKRDHLQFLKGAVIAGVAFVAISTAMFGTSSWKEYYERIQVAQHEKFYGIQYSLKTVFLQAVAPGQSIFEGGLFPAELKQPRADVNIEDYTLSFLLARLLFTGLILVFARRATDVEAFLLGPLLVFTWLTVNMYYWNMLGLFALGLALRRDRPMFAMLLGLPVIFMSFYLYQHTNHGFSEGYAVALLMCVWIAGASLWEWRESRQAATVPAAPGKKQVAAAK